jgi:non-specific serine/threonine protein kinase
VRRLAALAVAALAMGGCGGTSGEDPPRGAAGDPPSAERWKPLASSKLSRTEVGAARIGRSIYVVGGFERSSGRTTAATERYAIGENRWSRVRGMPIALNHAAAVSWHGRLYVVGGYADPAGLSQEQALLLRYDPRADRWKRLADPPSARAALAAAVVGDRLYAVGGVRGGAALGTLEIYDLRKDRWTTGPDMEVAREHLAASASGGFVYALAGRAAGEGNFAAAERFNTKTGAWERLRDMAKPRGGIAAATVHGDVVVFGGEEGAGTIREVERFDTAKRRWSRLPAMRTPRHGLGGASLRDRIYSLEGGPQPGFHFSSALEVLDVP